MWLKMDMDRIAIVGGSGALGSGLASRLARAGFSVAIGSRNADRAEEAAIALRKDTGSSRISGHDNRTAAEQGEIVIVTVPFDSQIEVLRAIGPAVRGKILVDTTVPLVPPKVMRVQLPAAGSAAALAAEVLGPDVRLVTGFHNVSAVKLRGDEPVDCDVLVFGDEAAAREAVVEMIHRLGIRAVHGGPLANSAAAEAMTSVLIWINKRYGVKAGAGLTVTGIADS